MKTLIALTAALLVSEAQGAAVASLYNGEHVQLAGQVLVQDADKPAVFYLLPQSYELVTESFYDEASGQFGNRPAVNHHIGEENGRKYSIYTVKLQLRTPSQRALINATLLLRRKFPGARIEGTAPICGINVDLPPGLPVTGPAHPEATQVKYSIRSTPDRVCGSILSVTQFNMEIKVPIEREPQIARDITSDVGLVLPSLELVLPYKYRDKVTLHVKARNVFEQMKASVGLQGTWKAVSAGVKANTTRALQTLQMTGGVKMDCQNQDKTVCDHFRVRAEEILNQIFLKYTSTGADSGVDKNSLLVSDDKKTVDASVFKVEAAVDSVEAERMGEFDIDFTNVVYDSVKAQVQLDISGVPLEIIDPSVRQSIGPRP